MRSEAYQKWAKDVERDEIRVRDAGAAVMVGGDVVSAGVALDLAWPGSAVHHDVLPGLTYKFNILYMNPRW
jgi:hypothetical protein